MLRKSDRSGNLFRYWRVSLVVGVLGIATGVACVVVPADSLAVLTVFFISVLVVGGIFNIAWAVANRNWNGTWGWSLARGLIEVLLGVWLMLLPLPLVTTLLIYVVGFWMLFQSVLGICESCALAPFRGTGWGWLLACNILSLICSFVFLDAPLYGGIFILACVGTAFILYGIFRIVLAFVWRRLTRELRRSGGDGFVDAEVVE